MQTSTNPLLCSRASDKSAESQTPSLMSWSHRNLKFVFSGLSDLVPRFYSKAMWAENAAPTPPSPLLLFSDPTLCCCPLRCLTLPRFYPVYQFGKACDLAVQLPRWPVMVYFVSKCILIPPSSNLQDTLGICATRTSHELTCLQCSAAIVCHTFQIKGSQDGQCLRDAGSCRGLRLAAPSAGMVFGGWFDGCWGLPRLPAAAGWCLSGSFMVTSWLAPQCWFLTCDGPILSDITEELKIKFSRGD